MSKLIVEEEFANLVEIELDGRSAGLPPSLSVCLSVCRVSRL
eukprot:SAG22_NODE_1623_length_3962_cov_20.394253_5_plen_42_part_00